MPRRLTLVAILTVLVLLAGSDALADDGPRWRRTTPRASLIQQESRLELRVPPRRAWGVASAPLALEAGAPYRARANLAVAPDTLRGAFLRVALYASGDGRGRQRLVLDSPLVVAGSEALGVRFSAPDWARTAKLRVLARGTAPLSEPFLADDVRLLRVRGVPPEVVLRNDD